MATVKDGFIFGRFYQMAISKDWDGFDCGFVSVKLIHHPENTKTKALRLVFWRLAIWLQVT